MVGTPRTDALVILDGHPEGLGLNRVQPPESGARDTDDRGMDGVDDQDAAERRGGPARLSASRVPQTMNQGKKTLGRKQQK